MLPNFLICGAAGGGTSFLSSSIIQHPDIYLPKKMRPEPHYFYYSDKYQKPISWYSKQWFSEVNNELAVGEKSSSYMFGPEVPERIKKHIPNIKLIFLLRNPIERTFTNYRYTVMAGLEDLSFEEALINEESRLKTQKGNWVEVQAHNYTGRSYYYKQISNFLKYFRIENMLILKAEDLYHSALSNIQNVFRFLNVDDLFVPKLPPKYRSFSVKDRKLQMTIRDYFGERFDVIIESIRKGIPVRKLIETREDEFYYKALLNNLCDQKGTIDGKIRDYLLELFMPDMLLFKDIITFDISDWR